MNITVVKNIDTKKEVLVLGLFTDDQNYYAKYNHALHDELTVAIKNNVYELEFGSAYSTKLSNSLYSRILVLCLGKKQELTTELVRRTMGYITSYMRSVKLSNFTTNILQQVGELGTFNAKMLGMSCAEGLILSDYSFNKYISKKNSGTCNGSIQFSGKDEDLFRKGFDAGIIIGNATNYSKDLINEPANVVTPEYLEKATKQLFGKNPKIKIRVLNKQEIEKEGLNALLGVSKGSDLDPKLILIQYNAGTGKPTAIVGKGITFDSGGYDIKPAGKFADMKCDMSGAAAVIGTIKAACDLDLKKNILGVIPTCENMINGSAQRPGDIVKAYNGKTIEIGNTDAEGRLVLADAIAYAEKNYSPEIIIDLATLTGACVVALGFYYSALYINDESLGKSLLKAGMDSYDRLWLMPFDKDYQHLMDGDISDLKNISKWDGHRAAGSITGAVFINKFVDKARWAHIDIAGPAFLPEPIEYNQKYATGTGVRLLTYYFMQ